MWLSKDQLILLYQALDKYPNADTVSIRDVPNGSGIGPDTVATIYDAGNPFKGIKPAELGKVNITNVGLW